MKVSIIIPTYNRNDLLDKCLERLNPDIQELDKKNYEVIVSDDSPNNIAKNLIESKHSWVKWVSGTKKGPAANRNNGAKYAKGDWLIFLDDDVIPNADLLKNYSKAIVQFPERLAYEGSIVPDDWELLKKDLSECPINTEGNLFWSANISINKQLFDSFNGFDERYLMAAHEDQQIKVDIEKRTKIYFLKECQVVHPVRFTTVKKQIQRIPNASKNYVKFVNKNEKISLISFFKNQFMFHLRSVVHAFRRRKFKIMLIELVWLFYGVPLNAINLYNVKENE